MGATLVDRGFSASQTLTPRSARKAGEPFITDGTLASSPQALRRVGALPVIDVEGLGDRSTPGAAEADLNIEDLLGEGGMGQVHSARQRSLGRSVAIKTLRHPDADARASLLNEGMLAGALEHPGIVPVHALGLTTSGDPVLVMKRVEGKTLREIIEESPPDGITDGKRLELVEILMAVCNAAHYAHTHGILHRDIKPSNIMLGRFGEVYLVDWGIATELGTARGSDRPTATVARMMGTAEYMAPEMATTGVLDVRTDVFLLGATLHAILTGEPRHRGDSWLEVIYAAVECAPPAHEESVPEELAAISRRATLRDPDERHQTALELREDLARYARLHTVLSLVHVAEERLAQSSQLLGVGSGTQPRDALRRVLLECRFAFVQALREAPDHVGARQGLRSCLLTMVDQELSTGNVEGAHALLGEVDDPPPALALRVHHAVDERERLRRVAAEVDLSVSGRLRRKVVLVAGAALLAACVWTLILHAPSHPGMVATAALNFVLAIGLPLLARGSLGSAVNQRIRMTWLSTAGMFLLGRLVGAGLGLAPASVLAMEQVALAGVVAVVAAAWMPSLLVSAAVLALGAVVSTLFPMLAGPTFVVTSAAGMLGSALARGRSMSGRTNRPRPT